MAQRGGVDCNWVGLTESYPIENGTVLNIGNRDSGCDTRGETPTHGIEALPQKRRVLQFLKSDQTPEDLFLRIGKSEGVATTLLRLQSIGYRERGGHSIQGHRGIVAEREGFVTLSTRYPQLYLSYIPGNGEDPIIRAIDVADLYEGDFLQLKIGIVMEGELAKITVQGLNRSRQLILSAPLGPVFPEIWQADANELLPLSTHFRVRLCNAAGLARSAPCAVPNLGN